MNACRGAVTLCVLSLLSSVLAAGPAAAQATGSDDSVILARSLVSEGNTARLQHVLAKARRGETVTVAVIGGSITAGAKASTGEKNWGSLVARWWRETFPTAKVEFVNAGIGATGSNYAALRAQRDLLSHKPDFVGVEFAVNDGNTKDAAETLEGLIRQILNMPNQPAVMLIFTMHHDGSNAQEWHSKVGAHYDLPMVSFRDALWPEIKEGRMKWEDVEADGVHPNDRGHAYMAQFMTTVIDRVRQALPPDANLPAIPAMPAPLFTDIYEHTALAEGADLQPTANHGWEFDAKAPGKGAWKTEQPGSVIEFEVTGRVILLTEYHVRGPMGKAKVQVDDLPPTVVDAWFDQTWGGWRCTHTIATGLEPIKHRVRLELLAERNPQSAGNQFMINAVGAAGTQ
jgi:lysophospholipase L1-like esterase